MERIVAQSSWSDSLSPTGPISSSSLVLAAEGWRGKGTTKLDAQAFLQEAFCARNKSPQSRLAAHDVVSYELPAKSWRKLGLNFFSISSGRKIPWNRRHSAPVRNRTLCVKNLEPSGVMHGILSCTTELKPKFWDKSMTWNAGSGIGMFFSCKISSCRLVSLFKSGKVSSSKGLGMRNTSSLSLHCTAQAFLGV